MLCLSSATDFDLRHETLPTVGSVLLLAGEAWLRHNSFVLIDKWTDMLRDGLYGLHFQNRGEDFGSGVVSLRDGFINGGDHGFAYQGQLLESLSGGEDGRIRVRMQMHIHKWNPAILSVIPGLNSYTLDVQGHYDPQDDTFQLTGVLPAVPGICLDLMAVRIGDLLTA
jgi:hypothetical protein